MKFLSHKREINQAFNLLSLEKRNRNALNEADRSLLLGLMGNAALAGAEGFAIDPTVRLNEAEACSEQAKSLGIPVSFICVDNSGIRKNIDLDKMTLAKACETAIGAFFSSGLDKESFRIAKRKTSYKGKVFPWEETSEFQKHLSSVLENESSLSLKSAGLGFIEQESIRGNKFLAGLALNDAQAIETAFHASAIRSGVFLSMWDSLDRESQQIFLTECITGFRKFLFLNLCCSLNAVYPCSDQIFLEKVSNLNFSLLGNDLVRLLEANQSKVISQKPIERLDFSAVGCYVLEQACKTDISFNQLLEFASSYGRDNDLNSHVKAAYEYIQHQNPEDYDQLIGRLKVVLDREKSTFRLLVNKAPKFTETTGALTLTIAALLPLLADIDPKFTQTIAESMSNSLVQFGAGTTALLWGIQSIGNRDRRFASTMNTLNSHSVDLSVGGPRVSEMLNKMMAR